MTHIGSDAHNEAIRPPSFLKLARSPEGRGRFLDGSLVPEGVNVVALRANSSSSDPPPPLQGSACGGDRDLPSRLRDDQRSAANPQRRPLSVDPAAQPTEDLSGALTALASAIGALAKSSGPAPTADDCSYTTYVIGQLANATPAERWRGTYETITNNMRTIAALCAADPASADAVNLARLTRPNVVTILNEEQYNGQITWG